MTQETTLTATVQAGSGYAPGSPNTASTRIVAADPAVTASIEEAAYTLADADDVANGHQVALAVGDHRLQGAGDGRGRHHDRDLHGDGEPGGPGADDHDVRIEHRRE